MSLQNMQSNAVRGKYMNEIMDKTMNEIHADMVTVFGPGAMDAFITKDQQPYFTRDGKEVISSLKFDNELSMYILKIIYQAVYNQAKAVGDGTTTVAILYTNLYNEIRAYLKNHSTISREKWNTAMRLLIDYLKSFAVPMDDRLFKKMLFTCTQDHELSDKIYNNLRDAIMSKAFITINKSNIEEDFEMIVNRKPMIPATRQWSIRPVNQVEDNCVIYYCNGALDLTHEAVLLDMMAHTGSSPYTFIILCTGVTDVTRKTLKKVVNTLKTFQKSSEQPFDINAYSNIAIYTLNDYRKYDSAQIEDISTIITDENGIGGYVNALTYEILLYNVFGNPNTPIEDLNTYDIDPRFCIKMKEAMNSPCSIEFDDIEGIKIDKELGPIAKARYEELRKEMEEEKSEVRKVTLQRRLKTMYGEFIEINVGSKLIKDSQRKYELILDAVLSASEAVEHGVLTSNSLLNLYNASKIISEHHVNDEIITDVIGIITDATGQTILDMINNVDPGLKMLYQTGADFSECDPKSFDLGKSDGNVLAPYQEGITYEINIVEPVTIITTMLENSTVILDLAQARTFHLNGFMNNYL